MYIYNTSIGAYTSFNTYYTMTDYTNDIWGGWSTLITDCECNVKTKQPSLKTLNKNKRINIQEAKTQKEKGPRRNKHKHTTGPPEAKEAQDKQNTEDIFFFLRSHTILSDEKIFQFELFEIFDPSLFETVFHFKKLNFKLCNYVCWKPSCRY